jgi:LuxR family glucitol operon transcriptional activator
VASGKSTNDLLNKEGETFEQALNFCFSGLYNQLQESEKKIISILACSRKPVSAVELRYILSALTETELEGSLNSLKNSSMLNVTSPIASEGRVYLLTEIADQYVKSNDLVSNDIYKLVKSRKKEIQAIIENDLAKIEHYQYDTTIIRWEGKDEQICSTFLKKAMQMAKKKESEGAKELINTAKSLMPEFSEVYRISGLINRASPFKAESDFERALELSPRSTITLYSFAQFLDYQDEFSQALNHIEQAINIDGEKGALITLKAKLLTRLGQYEVASSIYEKLLSDNSGVLRKFRISTYDQAAECYRRMSELSIKDRDEDSAKKYLERSYEIIHGCLKSGDHDKGISKRLVKIIKEIDLYSKTFGTMDLLNRIMESIEENINEFCAEGISTLRTDLMAARHRMSELATFKSDHIIDILIHLSNPTSGRVFGTIESLIKKTDIGFSYGFINSTDDVRYFFHRSELNPQDIMDNLVGQEKHENINVTFIPTETERGPTALDVKLR